jgi:hypothetical protein
MYTSYNNKPQHTTADRVHLHDRVHTLCAHLDQLGGDSNPARAVTAEAEENDAALLGRRHTCSRTALSNRDVLSDRHGSSAERSS